MQFYRVYHIGNRGEITGLTNFSAASDAAACEQAEVLMARHVSPGVELWQHDRRVHCTGIAPSESAAILARSLRGAPIVLNS